MEKIVELYSKPNCVQCVATEKALSDSGVSYMKIDVTKDSDALSRIKHRGFLQVPVVNAFGEWWSGFRPDKLNKLTPN